MTMATLLLAKTLWLFGYGTSAYPCHTGAFSLNMRITVILQLLMLWKITTINICNFHQGMSILAMQSNGLLPQVEVVTPHNTDLLIEYFTVTLNSQIYSLNDWGHTCIFILSYYHHWALLCNDLVSELQNLLLYLDFTISLSTLQTYVPTVNHICVPWCQQMAESVSDKKES